ncbi:hypothetical protein DVH24_040349 [Malus domestica]|uniref:TPX2 C-terminal domain-containing protein n=1 Tax=Malus domestica TaxID=3750 RepID=A0A498IAF1_MALDO|nr:hypothetical protein DVH24_040349 [Malus domestica]
MSGEIEEPVGFSCQLLLRNGQADSLHSGSISFGRFENEVLSWEKRSSFSHNRYVEEVEKCLKPGSVIERKAYFEAQFKKKGFPKPNLLECYSGSNHQVCENDVLESDAYGEEFEDGNEDNSCAHFDETSEGSEYHGDFEVKECEREDPEVSLSDPQRASELNDEHILVDIKDDNPEETHQTGIGCDMFSSSIDEPETNVNENHNGDAVNADESCNSVNMNPKTAADEEVNITIVESLYNSSSKLKAGKESKISKSRVKSKASISPVKRSISAESSKVPTNKSNTREREGTRRTYKEKLSSKTAIPPTHSVRRTPKSEDSTKLKGNSAHESRSDKEYCVKNLGEPQPPAVKPESRGRQMANSMSTNPGSGATSRLLSHSETGKSEAPTDSDSVNTTDLPEASRETNFMMAEPSEASSVSSTTLSSKNLSRDTTKGEVMRTKEREKNVNTQKHRSLESGKMAKSQKTEGKQKVGGERNSREMARKGVKVSVGFGSSSRMGHLTVGVAS